MPENHRQTYYETLQVHPAAPTDLVTAAYWRLNHEVEQTSAQGGVDRRRHELAQAYAVLADPASRDSYDRSAGIPPREHVPKVPTNRPFLLNLLSARMTRQPDYYEIIRVQPDASPGVIQDAYETMRTQYLRLIRAGHAPVELLDALEEAYGVASNVERRRAYDRRRLGRTNGASTTTRVSIAPPAVEEPAFVKAENIVTVPAGRAASESPELVDTTPEFAELPARSVERREEQRRRRLRSILDTVARFWRGLRRVVASVGWLLRTAVIVLSMIPRGVFGFVKFFVAVIQSFGDTGSSVEPRVRRIWPKEEEAIIARLSSSADRFVLEPGRSVIGLLAIVELLEGPEAGARFEVSRWPISIGSGRQCDIILPDLAPEQLRLLNREDKLILYSLSENPPVHVNDDAVAWFEMTANDRVHLGPHTLRVSLVDVTV